MCECYKGANELRYCGNHSEMSGKPIGNLEMITRGSYSSIDNSYLITKGGY